MTVCGFVVRDGDGFLWADTERYVGGLPMAREIDKVAVSPGGLAAVVTGHSSLCAEVRRFVAGLGRASFSAVISRLPAELRRAVARRS